MDAMPPPPAQADTAAMQRHLRSRALAMTPAERLTAMRELIAQARARLESNPAGLAHFMRRNFKARAVSNAHTGVSDGT